MERWGREIESFKTIIWRKRENLSNIARYKKQRIADLVTWQSDNLLVMNWISMKWFRAIWGFFFFYRHGDLNRSSWFSHPQRADAHWPIWGHVIFEYLPPRVGGVFLENSRPWGALSVMFWIFQMDHCWFPRAALEGLWRPAMPQSEELLNQLQLLWIIPGVHVQMLCWAF